MITLIKMSTPGWEKEFGNVENFKAEFWKHVCGMCRRDEHLTANSLIVDMWATPCGCEYDIEDPNGLLTPLS